MNTTATPAPPIASSDAAWASVDLPQPASDVVSECRDLEALLRLNPFWYFNEWRATGADTYRVRLRNESNNQTLATTIQRTTTATPGFALEYADGLKRRTVFLLEDQGAGSRLTIVDDYEGTPADERARRTEEVDRSLLAWARAIQRYFRRLQRWSWLPGWRWYIRRVWIPMQPSARRIVWLLYVITLAEFVVFLIVLAIYAIEQNK